MDTGLKLSNSTLVTLGTYALLYNKLRAFIMHNIIEKTIELVLP